MNSFKANLGIVGIAGLLYAGSIVTVVAAPVDETELRAKAVHIGDLNIESTAGAKALYSRIRIAAKQLCQPSRGVLGVPTQEFIHCFNDAVDTSVAKINSRTLTALHRGATMRNAKS